MVILRAVTWYKPGGNVTEKWPAVLVSVRTTLEAAFSLNDSFTPGVAPSTP